MTDDDRRMVETLLVAQVLLLERELAREVRQKRGHRRLLRSVGAPIVTRQ